ncbi:TetR family transcriptional regulator [Paenibacillus sp. P26]|nr:TetR family transcriptional regulator [Paenibacillus sp. P26]UUZ92047.1 TetR family transcriptional regulator [Paenibacillus sp. P25]
MSNNKRTDILEAALSLFAERGYDGTTVPAIAEQAKVGAGTIYRYFENKEVLVNSLFQECVEQLAGSLLTDAPSAEAPIRERFHHFFVRFSQFANGHDKALAFIDSHVNALFLDEASNKRFNEFLDVLRGMLDEGKRQGIICPSPSDALIAMVYGALVRVFKVIKNGVVEPSSELLQGIEESCWNAIRAH